MAGEVIVTVTAGAHKWIRILPSVPIHRAPAPFVDRQSNPSGAANNVNRYVVAPDSFQRRI